MNKRLLAVATGCFALAAVGCPATDTGSTPIPDSGDQSQSDAGDSFQPDASLSLDAGSPDAGASPSRPLALTPPMGWNTWNKFACNVSEQLILQMADALVSSGMRELGYEFLVIDDCWQVSRAEDGTIVPDRLRFPHGMKYIGDYLHERGLKFGIYTDAGFRTCQGRPGSYGYEQLDARTYASWGVDYIKEDWCYADPLEPRVQYAKMRDAIQQTGRPMVFSLCDWGVKSPWIWGPDTGQLWRTTGDIEDNWASMLRILDESSRFAASARKGAWNDPDMLEVGNGGMTDAEYRAHFSLWAMMAAPLIAGNDLRSMEPGTREILTNAEVIAVDQDEAGIQGVRVRSRGGLEVWSKPLAQPGARAALLFNRTSATATIEVGWTDLGLSFAPAKVRDLWAHRDLGVLPSFQASVPSHGVVMLKVEGTEPAPPSGDVQLSDLTWTYAANAWGPVERDQSVGGIGESDGLPIRINSVEYPKGLGVHAESDVRFLLGANCSRFRAWVGVDDDVGAKGLVRFEVWADGQRLFNSGFVDGNAPPKRVDLDVRGKQGLRLVVRGAETSLDYDHADWADAQLQCGP